METPPLFNSVEDECRYWKERSKLYHKEWTDVKQEYDEYVEQSRQMEAEMDATLDQKQGVIRDLKMKLSSLEKENESLKLKLESHSIESTNLEKQLENIKKERDSMKDYLRQLEQKNDDLERAHRILNESIVDFEQMLDKAYEKNALLEMEVDEKEILQEKLQRLMDETRDLKQELNVKSRYSATNGSSMTNGVSLPTEMPSPIGLNGDILLHDTTSATTLFNNTGSSNTNSSATTATNINDFTQQRSLKRKPFADSDNLLNGNAMTASSRTTALNIVADMLRKLNLDKALLCLQCARFRCVCVPVCATSADNDSSKQRIITAPTHHTAAEEFLPPRSPSVPLGKNTSPSGANLNCGTNVFKRFAERINRNKNLPTTPTRTSANHDLQNEPR